MRLRFFVEAAVRLFVQTVFGVWPTCLFVEAGFNRAIPHNTLKSTCFKGKTIAYRRYLSGHVLKGMLGV